MADKDKFTDLRAALRFRDVIRAIVKKELDKLRPLPRYGRVYDFNRVTMTADVILVGDTTPTRVKMTLGVQPTRRDVVNGEGSGDFVKIEGPTNNQWITAVLNGPQFIDRGNLSNPRLIGGKLLDRTIASSYTHTLDLPSTAGNSMYVGRFDNEPSDADGLATIHAVVQQWGEATVSKFYIINILPFDTGGQWKRCIPNGYTDASNNDFQLEINTPDSHSFELRVRKSSGTASSGGYDFVAWIYGQNWVQLDDFQPFEDSDPAPILTHGVVPAPLVSQLGARAGYETPSYRRSPSGVALQGSLANTSGATLATNFTLFVMPKGLRPRNRRSYICAYSGGRADVDVLSTGEVILTQALGAGSWLSLEGVNFPPEQ